MEERNDLIRCIGALSVAVIGYLTGASTIAIICVMVIILKR